MHINKKLIIIIRDSAKDDLQPFSNNVPLMLKPGRWFLLAKCLKSTCGRVTFLIKMHVVYLKCHSSTGVFEFFIVISIYKRDTVPIMKVARELAIQSNIENPSFLKQETNCRTILSKTFWSKMKLHNWRVYFPSRYLPAQS